MKSFTLVLFAAVSAVAQTPDLYPQVRALVLEAEAASANTRLLKDGGNPHTWAGDILAHAGYLDDAERAYAKSPGPAVDDPPFLLWRAWIVYGQRARAERVIESVTNAEKKATYMASFADLLWRTGQPGQARSQYQAARAVTLKIANLARRKQMLATIDQGLQFVSDPPPNLVSASPHPGPRFSVEDSPIPAFPITTDGFQDLGPEGTSARAAANGVLMKQLYNLAAAGDKAGIERITEGVKTPFQKALGIASLEHILILQHQPELAEEYAKKIPETDSASSLAKAEALSAAAAQWLRNSNNGRARADFDSAKRCVFSVADLPFGRISVLVSIAAVQFKAQMIEEGNATFHSAIELAQKLPLRPHFPAGVRHAPAPLGVHYRDEAFSKILRGAIHAHDIEISNDAAEIWSKTSDEAGAEIVGAWLSDGKTEEAIAAARGIKDRDSRVNELLSIARDLLSEAGAPIF